MGFKKGTSELFAEFGKKYIPDFNLSLSGGRGVIFEVEKSRTIENNNDILDLWKCHICASAQYLLLMVPLSYNSRIVYANVLKRMEPFFREGNYINVSGVFVMGYPL